MKKLSSAEIAKIKTLHQAGKSERAIAKVIGRSRSAVWYQIQKLEKGAVETRVYIRDVAGVVPYWACDEDLAKARYRFKRLSGRAPSKKASIIAFTGTLEELDKISVNDLGDIQYPKSVSKAVLQ